MGKLWQRNYYEHIIRNEQSHQDISNYIIHNPEKWEDDNVGATLAVARNAVAQ
jgi:REP element-mobilizing transposase RayT